MNNVPDSFEVFEDFLPSRIVSEINALSVKDEIIEIILDYGFLPKLRLQDRKDRVLNKCEVLDKDTLLNIAAQFPHFGDDNRAGIDGTLHRISCLKNRAGEIIGLTIRIGRSFEGSLAGLEAQIASNKSILIVSPPGFGKTTMLREIARILSTQQEKRVMIVDTSNEIAGSGDIPHPCIGNARRFQVNSPEHHARAMIEAVENHMPEVIVVDEIGTLEKVAAARTIAERGIQLIGTAHGTTLQSILNNPVLNELLGGIATVTLGDEEARARGTQKTILERKGPAPFQCFIELKSAKKCWVYDPLEKHVDALLKGQQRAPLNIEDKAVKKSKAAALPSDDSLEDNKTSIFLFGLKSEMLNDYIQKFNIKAAVAHNMSEADIILTTRQSLKHNVKLAQMLRGRQLPVYTIASYSEEAMKSFFKSYFDLPAIEEIEQNEALSEIKEACKQVMENNRVVELSAQNSFYRQKQHHYVKEFGLFSISTGKEPNRRVRVFPQ